MAVSTTIAVSRHLLHNPLKGERNVNGDGKPEYQNLVLAMMTSVLQGY